MKKRDDLRLIVSSATLDAEVRTLSTNKAALPRPTLFAVVVVQEFL